MQKVFTKCLKQYNLDNNKDAFPLRMRGAVVSEDRADLSWGMYNIFGVGH